MERDFFTGNHYINSIIGEGTFVSGVIESDELMRIDGLFRGPFIQRERFLSEKTVALKVLSPLRRLSSAVS